MRDEMKFTDRTWVAPEVCPGASWAPRPSDLHSAIVRAEEALEERAIGRVIHALVALRAVLRSRITEGKARRPWDHDGRPMGPWQRRLLRRYAASSCAVDRLVDQAWTSCDFEALAPSVREELARLRRVESLDNQASLDQHWIDVGVGD